MKLKGIPRIASSLLNPMPHQPHLNVSKKRMLEKTDLARRLRATPFVHPNPSCDILGGRLMIFSMSDDGRGSLDDQMKRRMVVLVIRPKLNLDNKSFTTRISSHLHIILATTSRPTSTSAVVLLIDVPRPLFRPAIQHPIFTKSSCI